MMALSRVYVLCATVVLTIVKVHTVPVSGLLSGLFGGDDSYAKPPPPAPADVSQLLRQYYNPQNEDRDFFRQPISGALINPNQYFEYPGSVPGTLPGQLPGQLSGPLSGQLSGPLSGQLSSQLSGPLSSVLSGTYPGAFPGQLSGALSGPLSGQLAGPPSFPQSPFSGQLSGQLSPALTGQLNFGPGQFNTYPRFDQFSQYQPSLSGFNQGLGDPYSQLNPMFRASPANSAEESLTVNQYSKQLDSMLPSGNGAAAAAYADATSYRTLGNAGAAAESAQPQPALQALLETPQSQSPIASSLVGHRMLTESSAQPQPVASTNAEHESSAKDQ